MSSMATPVNRRDGDNVCLVSLVSLVSLGCQSWPMPVASQTRLKCTFTRWRDIRRLAVKAASSARDRRACLEAPADPPNVVLVLKRLAARPQGTRWLAGGIAAVVLALAVAWVLFVPTADWLAHHDVGSATGLLHETAVDNARGRLLTLGAGLLAAGALLFTARNFTLSREGHVTDRYTKAIEQLGSDKLDVRIGGIYALERIARDSARDHPIVMEVLSAFIREHSLEQWPAPDPSRMAWITRRRRFRADRQEEDGLIRPDLQAALSVIARRHAERDIGRIKLYGADLRGAELNGADLRRVSFAWARLNGLLSEANLRGASFYGADLSEVCLDGADLTGADLTGARWPADAPIPEGWKLDAESGRLRRAATDSGPAKAD
jgi:Pentapeptide repeats (8 copies)